MFVNDKQVTQSSRMINYILWRVVVVSSLTPHSTQYRSFRRRSILWRRLLLSRIMSKLVETLYQTQKTLLN